MPFEKTALFIDGENLYYTAKALDFDIDFKRLLTEFQRRGSLIRSYYYTDGRQVARPLIDWLDYNGFTVVTKPIKTFDDGEGRRKSKRNIAIELVVDALEISKRIDHMFLFSGDGDYRPLVEAAQRKGVSVSRQQRRELCTGRRQCSKNALVENSRPRLDFLGPWVDTESSCSPQTIHPLTPAPPRRGFCVVRYVRSLRIVGLHGVRPGKTRRG
jgi:NYN domain